MARVFVSYRRADGAYGVGWMAERLRSLDTITGVETAFHDAALRAGDDFPSALDAEIGASDLVIAVIGPEWWGRREQGPARIEDPDDWVVKEIAMAFEHGTRVIPVLMRGADHPLASEVHPSISAIAQLHALPFNDGRDLDTIVEHVESHLSEIDRDRARRAGLEERVAVPKLPRPWLIAAFASVAAVIGGLAMWLSFSFRFADASAECSTARVCIDETTTFDIARIWFVVLGLYSGAVGVVGIALAWRFRRVARLMWRPMLTVGATVPVCLLLLSFSTDAGYSAILDVDTVTKPTVRLVTASVVIAWGVIGFAVCGLGAVYSEPRSDPRLVGRRVGYLAIARDAERWSMILVAIEFALAIGTGAVLLLAIRQSDEDLPTSPVPNIVYAMVFSIVLVGLHRWATTRFDAELAEIDDELEGLPPRYRDNAVPLLEAESFDTGGRAFRVVLAAPILVALAFAVVSLAI